MLNESDRRAIRRHASIIETYEHARNRELTRLIEPHKERAKELWDKLQQGNPPCHESGSVPIMASLVWYDAKAEKEALEIHTQVNDELAVFARAHRPSVNPYDTPRKLVDWIDDRLYWLGERRAQLLSYTDTGQAVLKNKGWVYRPGEPRSYPEDEIRAVYREARGRAFAFVSLAPSLVSELPECHDPVVGLQNIRACFMTMVVGSMVPERTETLVPISVELSAESVLGLNLTNEPIPGPIYLQKLREALIRVRKRCGEMATFSTYPDFPWHTTEICLWEDISNLESILDNKFIGKIHPTIDQANSLAWTYSLMRKLPRREDRTSQEGTIAAQFLIEQQSLKFLDQILINLESSLPDPSEIEQVPATTKPGPTPDIRTPGDLALLAATALKLRGDKVTIAAVCREAGVNESNLRKKYRVELEAIKKLKYLDRITKRARRTGDGDFYETD